MSEVIYKKCPKCGTPMIRSYLVDNTSVPKFIYACPECREREIDSYPPEGFVSSEIPVSGSIKDWNTSFGPSIAKDIPTESRTQKDLHPNFQDRKFLTEEEFKNLIAANEGFTWDEYRREVAKDILCSMVSGGYRSGREVEQTKLAVQYANELIKQLKNK